jgi:hypothetical protein
VDPIAALVLDYAKLCLQPVDRRLLCTSLLVAGTARRGSLAVTKCSRFLLGHCAVAEGWAAQWDPEKIFLVGFPVGSAVGDWKLQQWSGQPADHWLINDCDFGRLF